MSRGGDAAAVTGPDAESRDWQLAMARAFEVTSWQLAEGGRPQTI